MSILKRWKFPLAALAIAGVAAWLVVAPKTTDPADIANLEPDAAAGEFIFHAGGCASCHAAEDATGDARLILTGGRGFPSPFGTFYAPNISPEPVKGIGDWQAIDLVNAMRHGTSPAGSHYYPAFPYATYAHAELQDIVSLFAYLQTLPPTAAENRPHDVGFPFNIRASLGGWKLLFLKDSWAVDVAEAPEIERGRYLVESLAHCGECHTPRNILGGLKRGDWLTGAPDPSGKGLVPNITPGALEWSSLDIVSYLKTGFTPEFDTAGGHMADVIENMAQLPDSDVAAIVAYLKTL